MSSKAPVLTPDLIKVLKIFLGSALGIVLLLSFFDGYRANNTGKDRAFQVADADRLFFVNLRSIHYDREVRPEAAEARYDSLLFPSPTTPFQTKRSLPVF